MITTVGGGPWLSCNFYQFQYNPPPADQQPPAQVNPPLGIDGAGAEDRPVALDLDDPLHAVPPPI